MSNQNDTGFNQLDMPLVALRDIVLFPNAIVHFDIGRAKSAQALEDALENDSEVFVAMQKNAEDEVPEPDAIYTHGTVTKIRQAVRLPGFGLRVVAEGIERGKITAFVQSEPYIRVQIETLSSDAQETAGWDALSVEALMRSAKESFEEYAQLYGRLTPEAIMSALSSEDAGRLADCIGMHIAIDAGMKQMLLEEGGAYNRLAQAMRLLQEEIEILSLQRDISVKVKSGMDKNQRDYYLREQLKVIHTELGEHENLNAEVQAYRERMNGMFLPSHVREKAERELKRLERAGAISAEAGVIRDYLDWILDLTWDKKDTENKNLARAQKILERDHYGLEMVKERIIEFLAVRRLSNALDAPILCFVGPPGVGKTSIAKSIAAAVGRKYVRISLGGVRDEAEIRGHRKTYVGAMPGRVIYAMKQAGTLNPLILLDEIDKMSSDFRGNPGSALLEVLDGEQNAGFRDHYLELPYDLSDVLFICTANRVEGIPQPLLDRLELITLTSYTEDEKLNIALSFLIPKQLTKHGLSKSQLRIEPGAIQETIRHYTKEAGVRQLERAISQIMRKAVKELLLDADSQTGKKRTKKRVTIRPAQCIQYLGQKKYRYETTGRRDEIGLCHGLAWTSVGGDMLSIEANTVKGSGKLELTGNMGNVMKESAQVAVSYIRSRVETLGLRKYFYKDTDIHIHIPEGAVPKDGPSAGITMATAMISALTQRPVRGDVGMTGEVTIRGRVLPIGGLKEKVLAAKRAGLQKILIPAENAGDLAELSESIREGLVFVNVSHMDEVLQEALVEADVSAASQEAPAEADASAASQEALAGADVSAASQEAPTGANADAASQEAPARAGADTGWQDGSVVQEWK